MRAARDPASPLRPSLEPAFTHILRSRLPTLARGPVPADFPQEYRIAVGGDSPARWTISRSGEAIRVSEAADDGRVPDLATDPTGLALVTGPG